MIHTEYLNPLCCRPEVTANPRHPDTATGSGTSAAYQNHTVDNLQTTPLETARARVQPKIKTFNPSSYFPKPSKSVTLR